MWTHQRKSDRMWESRSASATPERSSVLWRWTGWWVVATAACALLIAIRYLAAYGEAGDFGTHAFRVVMLIAHFGLLTAIVLSPVVLLATLRASARLVRLLGVLLASSYLLLLLLDTEVYRLYRFHIDGGVMNLLIGGAGFQTFIFPRSMYLQAAAIAFAVVAGVILLASALWWLVRHSRPRPAVAACIAGAFSTCLAGFHAVHVWADARVVPSITMQTAVLPLPYAATAKRWLRRAGFELPPRESLQVDATDSLGLEYPLHPVHCERQRDPANIVLVLIDSWRFDALTVRATPHIAAFADRASVFTNHLSGGNATRIGVFSLFYSIPGTYWHRALDENRGPVIVQELLEHDYDIEVFRSAPLFSPEFDRTVFVELDDPRMRSEGLDPAEWDRDLTNDFLVYLDRKEDESPFFAFLFYDAPHDFDYPEGHPEVFEPSADVVNYLEIDADTDPTPLRNRYLNSVNYVDTLVGEVLDALERQQLLDETIVVITGDHGQEFNDSGANFWGHNSNFNRYQTGVPLVWYEPGRASGIYHHRTSHFDLMPTLLGTALDCEIPFSAVSVGRPLFESTPRDVMVLSDYNTFAIVEPDRFAEVRQYGVAVFRPPYERIREARVAPEVVSAALEHKSRFYRTPAPEVTVN